MKLSPFVLQNLPENKKYLLAVSGGMDSMVLLRLFYDSPLHFSVVHCNFQLRGEESDGDEKLVREYCEIYNLELFTRKFDTLHLKKNRESVEMVARKLRYEYFDELLAGQSFDYLVTAHHLNDQAETFFINLLRGSGLKGLSGMKIRTNNILRPLLPYSRQEIMDFAERNEIIWREDHTNQELEYLRNKIRHKVIPELESINPSFLQQIEKSMGIINSSRKYIEKKVGELMGESKVSEKGTLCIFSRELLRKADFLLVYYFFSQYGFTSEKDCKNILLAETGSIFESGTHKIWIDREHLLIEGKNMEAETEVYEEINQLPFQLAEPFSVHISLSPIPDSDGGREMIDAEKVTFPLILRNWKEGDYFYPINGEGKKKVSKYLKDKKVSMYDKNKVLVLCDHTGTIVWLVGFRLDDRFKVSDSTRSYIILSD